VTHAVAGLPPRLSGLARR